VEVQSVSERIQEICAQIAVAQGPELESLTAELRKLLRVHAQQVRKIVAKTWIATPDAPKGNPNPV